MVPRRYVFVSRWRVAAPLDDTWTFLTSPGQRWVDWWPGLETADVRRTADLVGSCARCTWRSPVGYRLTFALTLTDVDPGRLVVLAAEGDLTGTSLVEFAAEPGGTRLDIELRVATTRPWMNAVAPLLRPLFHHGHRVVMRHGERGLRRVLGSAEGRIAAGAPVGLDPSAGVGSPSAVETPVGVEPSAGVGSPSAVETPVGVEPSAGVGSPSAVETPVGVEPSAGVGSPSAVDPPVGVEPSAGVGSPSAVDPPAEVEAAGIAEPQRRPAEASAPRDGSQPSAGEPGGPHRPSR